MEKKMTARDLFNAYESGPGHYPGCNSLGAWGGYCSCGGVDRHRKLGRTIELRLIRLETLEANERMAHGHNQEVAKSR